MLRMPLQNMTNDRKQRLPHMGNNPPIQNFPKNRLEMLQIQLTDLSSDESAASPFSYLELPPL